MQMDNIDALNPPAEIARVVATHECIELPTVNHEGRVLVLSIDGRNRLFLKVEKTSTTLGVEAECLTWLHSKLPVPEVIAFERTETHQYLLLSALPGVEVLDEELDQDLPERVVLVADGLRQIHSVEIHDCPLDRTLEQHLRMANDRVADGSIAENDFEDIHRGSVHDLLNEVVSRRPVVEDKVFTHGDYSLPNVMVEGGKVSGYVDWRDGGVGDRYRDLSIAVKSIARNWGQEWIEPFIQRYGLTTKLDDARLDYFRLLYRFF